MNRNNVLQKSTPAPPNPLRIPTGPTHTNTCTLSLSLSLSHTHTHTRAGALAPIAHSNRQYTRLTNCNTATAGYITKTTIPLRNYLLFPLIPLHSPLSLSLLLCSFPLQESCPAPFALRCDVRSLAPPPLPSGVTSGTLPRPFCPLARLQEPCPAPSVFLAEGGGTTAQATSLWSRAAVGLAVAGAGEGGGGWREHPRLYGLHGMVMVDHRLHLAPDLKPRNV